MNDAWEEEEQAAPPGRPAVLVVEDDADLREAMVELLATSDVDVTGVGDGEQAVYWLMLEPPPRAVVLDLRLPVINGWDLLTWLREQPEWRDLPVVVISGAPVEHVELTLAHEPVAWLQKPVDPRALAAVVEALCA